MRRFTLCSTVAMVALVGAIAVAQAPTAPAKIATMADHAALMKSNAQANGAIGKALASGAFADARTQLATLRTNLMTLRTFWTEKKNVAASADALKIVNDGLARAEALDKMLAAPAPDQMAAQAAAKEMGGNTCGACHKMMREGDATAGFTFRAGMNPF
jgi:cytochrome c556